SGVTEQTQIRRVFGAEAEKLPEGRGVLTQPRQAGNLLAAWVALVGEPVGEDLDRVEVAQPDGLQELDHQGAVGTVEAELTLEGGGVSHGPAPGGLLGTALDTEIGKRCRCEEGNAQLHQLLAGERIEACQGLLALRAELPLKKGTHDTAQTGPVA